MKRTTNLLTVWFNDFLVLSSDLAVKTLVHRSQVEAIFQLLSDFFGIDFFEVNPLANLKLQRLHFVQALLMQRNHAHYYKLFEFCMLVEKAKANDQVWQKINSVKYLSERLRDTMFELYVAALFESNGIEFQPNIIRQNQLVEGYCKLGNYTFLYECKRKRSIITNDLKMKSFVASDLLESLESQPFGFELIVLFKIKKKVNSTSDIHQTLKKFKAFIKNRTSNSDIKLECDFLAIEVKPLSIALEIEVIKNLLPIDGYLITKRTGQVLQGGKENFHIKAVTSGGHNKSDTVDKFMSALHEAKRQHKGETIPRLFIFENEHLADISAPLLRMDKFYMGEIRAQLERGKNQDLILVLFKNFMQYPPQFSAEIFGPSKFQDCMAILKHSEFGIVNPAAIFKS